MADKIVKEVNVTFTATDAAQAEINKFENRLEKMKKDAASVPNYITGKSGSDQEQLNSMSRFYAAQAAEANKLRQINRSAFEQQVRDEQASEIRRLRAETQIAKVKEEANLRLYGPAMNAAVEDAGTKSGTTFLDKLNDVFGRGSSTTRLMRTLMGGGALMAIGLAAREFERMGADVEKLAVDIGTGKIRNDEMAERLVDTLPIVGSVEKGFKSIAMAVTGIAADTANWNEELKRVTETSDLLHKLLVPKDESPGAGIGEESNKKLQELRAQAVIAGQAVADAQANADSYLRPGEHAIGSDQAALADAKAKAGRIAAEIAQITKARDTAIQDAKDKSAADFAKKEMDRNIEVHNKLQEGVKEYYKNVEEGMRERRRLEAEGIRESEERERKSVEEEKEKNRLARETTDRQNMIDKELSDMQIDELKMSGALTDKDKIRLDIAEKFVNKREQLLKILNDEKASDAQRAAAKAALEGLSGAEAAAVDQAMKGGLGHRVGTADTTTAGGLHGYSIAANAQAKNPIDEVKEHTKQNAAQTKRVGDLVQQLITLIGAPLPKATQVG